jgi:hypothetical protein
MEYPARTTINQHILLLRMASLMASTSTDPTGVPVSASELCSSSISSTNPRFASGDVQDRMARKRKTTVNTWAHAREPLISEPSRCGRKNEKIYYCMYCASLTYSTTVSTTFRNHLLKIYGIELEAHKYPIKKRRDRLIRKLSPRPARCMLQSNWQNKKKL